MDKDDFALLKVIASSIETIKEDLREMKEGMKTKVEISEFNQIKIDVDDLKKSKWFVLGASGAISTILHFFMK
jgi:hypothetical protein